eukprot:Plantae.Rhodophyta-Hildenbrandia_rubra.ctg4569.p1 GENE.Plantae.Rhodophyta-Hildenbrandia_rubra.ctg4569~~Plantae.Rhodophyta-Hildenbrandia_rubra.ctg4569.p1  ORF type:complete len:1110 (-),score=131.42 Plantae.Rhodophyta-Hildenbrandia_rubra.ctg4569:3712-7041(-)
MTHEAVHSRKSSSPSEAHSKLLLVLEKAVLGDAALDLITTPVRDIQGRVVVELRDDWASSDVQVGDTLHVVAYDEHNYFPKWQDLYNYKGDNMRVRVDAAHNLLVVFPHTLVNGSTVADSFMCIRKAVLGIRHRPPGGGDGGAALRGMLTHDLFQRALRYDGQGFELAEELLAVVEDLLKERMDELYICRESEADIRASLLNVVPIIVEWKGNFIGHGVGKVQVGKSESEVAVTAVRDIEELIWSPTFGLKGKIDATISLLKDVDHDPDVSALELKTGKSLGFAQIAHRAQVMLYTLLISDRYDERVTQGLLSYIRCVSRDEQKQRDEKSRFQEQSQKHKASGDSVQNILISGSRSELIAIIMARNKLAQYVNIDVGYGELPPLLRGRQNICEKCFINDSCLLQYKLCGQGPKQAVTDGPGEELFNRKTAHLSSMDAVYYKEWRSALAAEEAVASKSISNLWTVPAHEAEKNGTGIADLALVAERYGSEVEAPGERVVQVLKRHPQSRLSPILKQCHHVHGYVIVSLQNNHEVPTERMKDAIVSKPAVANGFISDITDNCVSVLVERNLGEWMARMSIDSTISTWRIDTIEILASYTIAKQNLELLFTSEESGGSEKLRSLIVELQKPKFKSTRNCLLTCSQRKQIAHLSLNDDQTIALELALAAEDYSLILGMPGTGKTTTLAAIIIAAAQKGKSVLLCSHTHAAVDNVLVKLLDLGFEDFVRLGRRRTLIDPRVRSKHVGTLCDQPMSMRDLEAVLEKPLVVATTCLGINHPVFTKRTSFDLVVIDEASQIVQPICLGPLRFAGSNFVLIGDHYQLPPLVRGHSCHASSRSLANFKTPSIGSTGGKEKHESLFRRLCEAHPQAVTRLRKQYRMCSDIMHLTNEIVYGGELVCGSDTVAQRKLSLVFRKRAGGFLWLEDVRNPIRRVIFLDTDTLDVRERATDIDLTNSIDNLEEGSERRRGNESSRDNEVEARIVMQCIEALSADGLKSEDVVILTPFRAQAILLKSMIGDATLTDDDGPEVKTVDQYQGKDKDCVLVSFVRSNRNQKVGPLLRDWRRVNVAITRAKSKLILIGSASTLAGGSHFLRSLIEHLSSNGSVVPVVSIST